MYQELKDTGIGLRIVEIHTSGSAQAWNEQLLGGTAEHIIAQTPKAEGEHLVLGLPPGSLIYYPSTKLVGKGAVVVGAGINGDRLYLERRDEVLGLLEP